MIDVEHLKINNVEFNIIPNSSNFKTVNGETIVGDGDIALIPDYGKHYLTFEAIKDTVFTFSTNDLQYSVNNGTTWNTLTAGTASPTIAAGNKVMWKQTGLTPTSSAGIGKFTASGKFKAYGNVMSLLFGDDFEGQTDLTGYDYVFYKLFNKNTKLIDASNLILPATTLANYCYYCMFQGCTSLTTTPELPATTLASNCYRWMFQGCTSLTTAPKLPATTLANDCYAEMFYGCTSLTTAPELPATTLANYCYSNMFHGCTSLTSAPELPATTLANYCYHWMFYGCTALTTAPELPATTLADHCYANMFSNCTLLTKAPEVLPATTLADHCYLYMFSGTSLTTAPELPATTLAGSCYSAMFYGCTALTTAPELPATTLADYCYSNMFTGCTSLNYIKALFETDITDNSEYTYNWANNVVSSGTFVKSDDATWNATGTNGVPSGW